MRAFLFGTFNPVTNAHIAMGLAAERALGPGCQVVYVPTADDYIRNEKGYGKGQVLPGSIRKELLEGAVYPYGFTVSDAELFGKTDGKTYNTIAYYGFEGSVLCIGMDNVLAMKKWYKWKELLSKCSLMVFKRGNMAPVISTDVMDVLMRPRDCYLIGLDKEHADTSSTLVRACCMAGDMDGVKALVPENVYEYMEVNENVYFG